MITKGGGYMEDNVVMRIICNETKAKDFLRRLSILCENNNFQYTEIQNEPYWKIEGRKEMLIEFGPVPVWNYGKWSEVYKYLFEQHFTIEYNTDENVDFCYYPSPEDSESYFVIFGIPANCFFPKPSKSIVH